MPPTYSPIPILLIAHGKGFNYFVSILQPLIHPTGRTGNFPLTTGKIRTGKTLKNLQNVTKTKMTWQELGTV